VNADNAELPEVRSIILQVQRAKKRKISHNQLTAPAVFNSRCLQAANRKDSETKTKKFWGQRQFSQPAYGANRLQQQYVR